MILPNAVTGAYMKLKPFNNLAELLNANTLLIDCANLLEQYEQRKEPFEGHKFKQLLALVDETNKSQHWITFDSLCHGLITTRQQRQALVSYMRGFGPTNHNPTQDLLDG